eukprot:scaffold11024_cov188-Skeletonema_marinoi.AAC.1
MATEEAAAVAGPRPGQRARARHFGRFDFSTSSYYGELGSGKFYKLRSIFALLTAYKVSSDRYSGSFLQNKMWR